MNKKLMALAIASAFVAPVAMADGGNVTISGQLNFSLDSLKGCKGGTGGTTCTDNNNNTNVSSNASNIVFKGSEDLGNGMNAFFQIQSFFTAGGTGNTDTSFGGTGDGVGSGATFVGVGSKSWGSIQLGKMESPFKILSRKVDLFGNQIGDSRNLTARAAGAAIGTSAIGTGIATQGWDLRPNNTVQYSTPNFNGFVGNLAYTTNMSNGAAADPTSSANMNAVDAWTASGTYENGPIFLGLGYEQHNLSKVVDPSVSGLDDEHAWRASGGYNFGDFKVVAFYQRESNLYVNTGNTNADRTTWGLGGAYKMGANTLKAQYYRTGDVDGTTDTSANLWALGVDHAMSKRTTVYAAYARTNNDNNANYSAFGGGHGDNPGTVTGKDPSGFSVGVIHNF